MAGTPVRPDNIQWRPNALQLDYVQQLAAALHPTFELP
jgi:hypothetical protein